MLSQNYTRKNQQPQMSRRDKRRMRQQEMQNLPVSTFEKQVEINTRKLFVGGLPRDCSGKDLFYYFKQFGEVLDVEVKMDEVSKRCRGFAFLIFKDKKVLDVIMERNEHVILGKIVDPKPCELLQANSIAYLSRCSKDDKRLIPESPDSASRKSEPFFNRVKNNQIKQKGLLSSNQIAQLNGAQNFNPFDTPQNNQYVAAQFQYQQYLNQQYEGMLANQMMHQCWIREQSIQFPYGSPSLSSTPSINNGFNNKFSILSDEI